MDAGKPRERLLGPALRTQPDRRLVALARDGSTPAQEEIVRRYRAALVRFAGSIVGPAAAEDVVQEALAKGLAALAGAGGELRLRPWLYAIVRNTALNHLRDAGPATEPLDESYDGVEQPPQALERREGVRSLLGGLRRLPRQQREAIVKRELEGRSHEEIAAELGVSSGAARQLIFRAREALRVGFGSLLPMPLLRWLAEGGAGGGDAAVGVAAGAGGGALAAKAAVAVFAAGAAVTAGVAIDHGARQGPDAPAAEAAVLPAVALPDAGASSGSAGGPAAAPLLATAGDDPSGRRSGRSGEEGEDREHGDDDSSGPGSGEREADDDGEDRGEHAGRGHGGGDRSGEDEGEDREDRSGHRGRSGDDEDDRSGSSGSRQGSRDDDRSGSSGSGDSDSDDSGGGSGSGSSGGGGDDYADDSGGGSGSGGDGGEVEEEDVAFTAPSPTASATAPVAESAGEYEADDDSSGSSGGGEADVEDELD